MKKEIKKSIKRTFALVLAFTLILGTFITYDIFEKRKDEAKADTLACMGITNVTKPNIPLGGSLASPDAYMQTTVDSNGIATLYEAHFNIMSSSLVIEESESGSSKRCDLTVNGLSETYNNAYFKRATGINSYSEVNMQYFKSAFLEQEITLPFNNDPYPSYSNYCTYLKNGTFKSWFYPSPGQNSSTNYFYYGAAETDSDGFFTGTINYSTSDYPRNQFGFIKGVQIGEDSYKDISLTNNISFLAQGKINQSKLLAESTYNFSNMPAFSKYTPLYQGHYIFQKDDLAPNFIATYNGTNSLHNTALKGDKKKKYTINFSGGAANCKIVAALFNGDTMEYFGSIGSGTSGIATLDLSSVAEGSYKMMVFSTDGYAASAPMISTLTVINDYITGVEFGTNSNTASRAEEIIAATSIDAIYIYRYASPSPATRYVIDAAAWEANKSVSNPNLAATIKIPKSNSSEYNYYCVAVDGTTYYEKAYTATKVTRTGTNWTENKNSPNVKGGDTITAANHIGYFVVSDGATDDYINERYVVGVEDWEADKSGTNTNLKTKLTVPTYGTEGYDDNTTEFTYYVVAVDGSDGQYFDKKYTAHYTSEKAINLTNNYELFAPNTKIYAHSSTEGFTGKVTWDDGSETNIANNQLYILPTSTWENLILAGTTTKDDVKAAGEENASCVSLGTEEAYDVTLIYYATQPGTSKVENGSFTNGYTTQTFTVRNRETHYTKANASYIGSEKDYGDSVPSKDKEFSVKMTLSDQAKTEVSLEPSQYYILPTSVWEELTESGDFVTEDIIKKTPEVNSLVIPTKESLQADSYDVTILIYDYAMNHEKVAVENSGRYMSTDDATCYALNVSIPLSQINSKPYESETSMGVTWNYNLDANGYAVNVYTTDGDVSQYIKNGVFEIPAELDGHQVKSLGTGSKDDPFVLPNVSNFTDIKFPEGVTINDYAFYCNKAFARINVKNVNQIGAFAFYGCKNISAVNIDGCAEIKTGAFGNCQSLESVSVTALNPETIMGAAAFAQNNGLKRVTLSGNMTLGKNAFLDDAAISVLNLDGFKGTIGKDAFRGCLGLSALSIPNGVTLEEFAFEGCTNLKKLNIDTEIVPNKAFENCYAITYVSFGENVKKVEYNWGGTYTEPIAMTNAIDTEIHVNNQYTIFEAINDGTDWYTAFMGRKGTNTYSDRRNVTIFVSELDLENEKLPEEETAERMSKYAGTYLNHSDDSWTNETDRENHKKFMTANGAINVTGSEETSNSYESSGKNKEIVDIEAFYNGKVYTINEGTPDKRAEEPSKYAFDKNKFSVKEVYSDGTVKEDSLTDFIYTDQNKETQIAQAVETFIKEPKADATTYPYGYYTLSDDAYVCGASNTDDFIKNHTVFTYEEEEYTAAHNYITYRYLSEHASEVGCTFSQGMYSKAMENLTASVTNNKELFTAAAAAYIDENVIPDILPQGESTGSQMLNVYYFPEGSAPCVVPVNVRLVVYTPEQDFFDRGLTYESVIVEIERLGKELTKATEDMNKAIEEKNLMTEELQVEKDKVNKLTESYNKTIEKLNDLMNTTTSDGEGYFGTIEVENEDGEKEKVNVVWINGKDCPYEETNRDIIYNGMQYKIYTGTADLDGNGEDENIEFFVAADGVHVTKVNDNAESEHCKVYTDTIEEIQRQMIAKVTRMKDMIDDLKANIRTLAEQLGIYDETFDDKSQDEQMELITGAISDILAKKEELEGKIASNELVIASYETAVNSIYQQLVGKDLDKKDVSALQENLAAILSEISSLQTANTTLAEQVSDLRIELATANAKIEELGGQIVEKDEAIKDAEATITDLENNIKDLNTAAGKLNDTIEAQKNTISGMQTNIDSLNSNNGDLQTEIESLNSNVTALSQSNQAQQERIEELAGELGSAQEKIEAGEATQEELEDTIASAIEKIGELKSENESQSALITSLMQNIADLTSIKDEQKATIDALNSQLSDLSTQNTALNNTVSELEDVITEQNTNIAELKAQIAGLQTEITGYQNTIKEQVDRIGALEKASENYVLTVDDAAELFNTSKSASAAEVKAAINEFVSSKIEGDKTIKAIQEKLNTTATGDALVALVPGTGSSSTGSMISNATSDAGAVRLIVLPSSVLDEAQTLPEADGKTVLVSADAVLVDAEGNPITEIPDGGVKVTFTVDGLLGTDNIVVLHKSSVTGNWETLEETHGNGQVTATFTSFSPVVIMKTKTSAIPSVPGNIGSSGNNTGFGSGSVSKEELNAAYNDGYNKGFNAATQTQGNSGINEQLNSHNSKLVAENGTLAQKVTTLTNEKKALSTKNGDLNKEVSELTSENKALTEDNKALTTANTSLTKEKDSLEKENKTLSAANEKLTTTNTALTKKNNSLEVKNNTLATKNESLKEKNTSLKTENKQLEAQNSSLEKQVTTLKTTQTQVVKKPGGGTSTPATTPSTPVDDKKPEIVVTPGEEDDKPDTKEPEEQPDEEPKIEPEEQPENPDEKPIPELELEQPDERDPSIPLIVDTDTQTDTEEPSTQADQPQVDKDTPSLVKLAIPFILIIIVVGVALLYIFVFNKGPKKNKAESFDADFDEEYEYDEELNSDTDTDEFDVEIEEEDE